MGRDSVRSTTARSQTGPCRHSPPADPKIEHAMGTPTGTIANGSPTDFLLAQATQFVPLLTLMDHCRMESNRCVSGRRAAAAFHSRGDRG